MTAYPGTGANYPTVFNVAAPERGPKHLRPRPFHLGKGVTAEVEADLGFDQDGVNNIRPAANTPNLDKRDDGLLAPSSFAHCQLNTMKSRVSISPAAVTFFSQNKGYLNVWIDSNRDGDWADELDCPQVSGGNFQTALEHIVIDYNVDVATLEQLAGVETIVCIKEESGDIRRVTDLYNAFGDRFSVFCGVDDLILESLALGATGWVSSPPRPRSNFIPAARAEVNASPPSSHSLPGLGTSRIAP